MREDKSKNLLDRIKSGWKKSTALLLAATAALGIAIGTRNDNLALGDGTEPAGGAGRDKNPFKEGLAVDSEETTLSEKSSFESEIEGLKTKEQVLQFLKETYANEYKEVFGETINPSQMKIVASEQSYIYKTSDGNYVSHGSNPQATECAINSSGASIVNDGYQTDGTMYQVIHNDEIIDAFMSIKEKNKAVGENKQVIPGENYTEMKDNPSVLAGFGNITKEAFELMDLMSQLEKDSGNGYLKQCVDTCKDRLGQFCKDYDNNKEISKRLYNNVQQQPTTNENNGWEH